MEYTHKGITITIVENGMFTATINGQKFKSVSLAGIKSQIDKKAQFKPFKALWLSRDGYRSNKVIEINVIASKEQKVRYRRGLVELYWITDTHRTINDRDVYPLGQKAALQNFVKIKRENYKKTEALEKACEKSERAAEAKLTTCGGIGKVKAV